MDLSLELNRVANIGGMTILDGQLYSLPLSCQTVLMYFYLFILGTLLLRFLTPLPTILLLPSYLTLSTISKDRDRGSILAYIYFESPLSYFPFFYQLVFSDRVTNGPRSCWIGKGSILLDGSTVFVINSHFEVLLLHEFMSQNEQSHFQ